MARISRIDDMKASRNAGNAFKRVYFQVKDEEKSTPEKKVYFWAKTDLVPTFRNYSRWKDFLRVGNVLANLYLKKDNTIDADSFPRFVGRKEKEPEEVPPFQESLLKI